MSKLISEIDLVNLDTRLNLPYMKGIDLTNYTPQHFGLDTWEPQFRIPDYWMKKIYRHDVYKDTDLPEPKVEVISSEQKKLLHDYLIQNRSYSPKIPSLGGLRSQYKSPDDDLVETLCVQDDDSQDSDIEIIDIIGTDSDFQTPNRISRDNKIPSPYIATCRHKIQPEEAVVEIALEKMKNLKPDEERRYLDLLKDRDFMKLLNSHVQKYTN